MDHIQSYGATRSSHRWATQPGNWDTLNLRAVYPSDNIWDIPVVPAVTVTPGRLIPYNDRYTCDHPQPGDAIHFFLDDYRFETLWSKPQRPLSRLKHVGAALTPDFSLWREMPAAMQMWQVYRNRWAGCWMTQHGIRAVPTISWSTRESFRYAFLGVPESSTVAISTVGVRDKEAKRLFAVGVEHMLHELIPFNVLVYGKLDPSQRMLLSSVDVTEYPTRWEM